MKAQNDEIIYFFTALDYLSRDAGWGGQIALSIETKLSEGYISQIINRTRKPSFDAQVKIAKALSYNYTDFLDLGKKLIQQGSTPANIASDGKRVDIDLKDIAHNQLIKLKAKKQSAHMTTMAAYDMLLRALQDQIASLTDTVKEMKNERQELIADLRQEQKRCWDRINAIQSHTDKMDETLDIINLDVGQVKDRMLDAARTGDIHHLEKISDVG